MEALDSEVPACNTGNFVEKVDISGHFEVIRAGWDDVSIGFDLTGSGSIRRLNEMPGKDTRRGKMLGEQGSWGSWHHLLGRSVAFWKAENHRLYVQAKLVPADDLCAPEAFSERYQELLQRMAVVGVVAYEPAWVTRLDAAVDVRCEPQNGKALLDALDGARLPRGMRTEAMGKPRSTVNFLPRVRNEKVAVAYCRNLKNGTGEPFGLIRTEARCKFKPKEMMIEAVENPALAGFLWSTRYGGLSGTVTRLEREEQSMKFADKVRLGEIGYATAERMTAFLDYERLGLTDAVYPPSVATARRREARKLGLAANDVGTDALELELGQMLEPIAAAWTA